VHREGQPVDPSHPQLAQARLRLATLEAIAELEQQGVLTPTAKPDQSGADITLNVSDLSPSGSGSSGGHRIGASIPVVAPCHRMSRQHLREEGRIELDLALTSSGLSELLGCRGQRCFDEAIAAFRRGLFLAATNLLGATNEAAWFEIGNLIARSDPKLNKPIADEMPAKVIQMSCDWFERQGIPHIRKSTVLDIRTQAGNVLARLVQLRTAS
jgi:hypothetical protein